MPKAARALGVRLLGVAEHEGERRRACLVLLYLPKLGRARMTRRPKTSPEHGAPLPCAEGTGCATFCRDRWSGTVVEVVRAEQDRWCSSVIPAARVNFRKRALACQHLPADLILFIRRTCDLKLHDSAAREEAGQRAFCGPLPSPALSHCAASRTNRGKHALATLPGYSGAIRI